LSDEVDLYCLLAVVDVVGDAEVAESESAERGAAELAAGIGVGVGGEFAYGCDDEFRVGGVG
jgi:hypothetical protein